MKKYFKKFSIIFVMALVLIGIGVIQNGSVANAATVGQQLTTPESGWKRYDDSNSCFTYSSASPNTSPYNYNGTYTSAHPNSTISFNFTGDRLYIIGFMADYMSSEVEVKIDGNIVGYINEHDGGPSFKTVVFSINNLGNKEHNVVLTEKTGSSWVFDAIDINENGTIKPYNENPSVTASSIAISKSIDNLQLGETDNLNAIVTPDNATNKNVTWNSSDSSTVAVDSTGKVTAVKEGKATITATTTDGSNLSATCTVNVTNPITPGITLNKTSDSLTIGQTDTLVVTTTPANAQVTWSSSDSSIATVDQTGKVTAIKAGTVTITATTSGGVTANGTVIITNLTGTNGGNTTPTNPTDNTGGTSTGTDGTTNIVNIAHAKGDNTNNAGGDVSIIFMGLPDTTLSVVKTADVKSVYVGDTFTYTVVVTNTGAKTAKSVVINDSAPNHIQFMPSGITTTQGTVDSNSTSSNILVNVGDIPPLGTVRIKIPATVIL